MTKAATIYAGDVAPISIETPYNHITIERFGSVIEMSSLWRSIIYRESAVDLSDLSRLVVPYTIFVGATAVFRPGPKNVLMIGLGGGGFNQFFQKAFPAASLDTVELDSGVLAVAQQHMAFKTSERNKVFILDGRMFLRRSNAIYDWIIVDAFRGGFVPSYLKTVEFYLLARSHLASDGVLVANVHRDAPLFPSDLRTMQAAFRQVGFFEVASTGNAVVAGANFSSPSLQQLLKNAEPAQFNDVFRRNVDLAMAASAFHEVAPTVNKNATLLTDDFAITEF